MKKIILLLFPVLFFIQAKSQEIIVDRSIKYKSGIYRNFEEFRTNSPSVETKIKISAKQRGYGFMDAAGTITCYHLKIKKRKAKELGKIFGFCDGQNVYINPDKIDLISKPEFYRVEYLGRYCFFVQRVCTIVYSGTNTSSSCDRAEKILNINTGDIIELNTKNVEEIISNDKDLFNDYQTEKKKGKLLKEYIIEYSEKHQDQINR